MSNNNNDYFFAARPKRRAKRPFRVEKLIDGEWRLMSEWFVTPDPDRLRKHASAFGGHTRLLRGGMLLRQWVCGQERDVEEQLECA